MKNYILPAILGVCSLIGTASAAQGDFYIGAKAGFVDADVAGLDDATNIGVIVGYNLLPNIAIEGEYTTTISDGDVNFGSASGDWDIDTLAVYGVYRTDGAIYFKGKAGLARTDADTSVGSFAFEDADTDLSAGIGAGFKLSNGGIIEVEYTILNDDFNFLSVGYIF